MISRAVFLALIAALLITSTVDAGNVYYVKKSGNDSSNGGSWASAWTTVEKVNSMMQPGDTVYFGTGIWYNSQFRPPAGGNASNVTVYACSTFSEASRGLTKIYGGELLTGWSVYSGSIYRINYSGPKSYVMGQDDQLLIPAVTLGGVDAPGRFFHDPGSGYIYAWLYGSANPDNNNTMIIARKEVVRLHLQNTDYVKIWGFALAYGSPQIVGYDAQCHYTSIEHCDLYCGGYEPGSNGGGVLCTANDGGKVSPDSSTYGRNNRILACTIGNLIEGGYPGSGHGSHGVTTYSEHRFQVDSCYFYPPIDKAILFKDKLDADTHIGNVARFNTIYGASMEAISWISNAYMDSVYGNTIYDCHNGIINWGSTTPPYEGHLFICNNTIYDVVCKGIMATENASGLSGANSVIKYNIIAGTDLSGCEEDNEIIGFEYSDPSFEDAYTIDSNMYYDCTENFRCRYNDERQFSSWRGIGGFDLQGHYNVINPGFSDPGSRDFSRPGAPTQMNRADYGDRQWTLWGAWQPTGDCPTPNAPSLSSPASGSSGLSQPVNLDWYNVSGASLYQVQVDNNSSFGSPEISAQPVSSNYSASGLEGQTTYYWRARAYNNCGWGSWSQTRTFSVVEGGCPLPATPTLATPATGATDLSQPVNLDWYDVSGATLYQVQVDNNSDYGSPEISTQPVSSNYSASGLTPGTTFYWRARAYNSCGWGNWSVTRVFSVEDDGCPPPAAPTLATPANGASDISMPVTLDWYDVSGALLYQLLVDDNSNFSSPEISTQPASSAYSASGLDGGTTFFWRVRTYDACEWGGWSSVRSFTTEGDCTVPPPPTHQTPPNGMSNMSQPIPLNWSDVGGASKYQVQIDDNSGFLNPEINEEPTESQYSAGGLSSLTYYYWRVRSYNACGWGGWTTTRYFVTDPYGSGDQTAPVISNVYVSDTTASTATIRWTTNEPATSRVFYVEGISSGDTTVIDLSYVYSHSVLLEGLYPDSYYEYRVISRDAAENERISGYYVFKTGGMGLDADGEGFSAIGEPVYYTSQPTLVVQNLNTNPDNLYYFEVATDSGFVRTVVSSLPVPQEFGETTKWEVAPIRLSQDQEYYWRASANLDEYSKVSTFTIVAKPHPYPNPFDATVTPHVTFTEIPSGSSLIITTINGEIIRTWSYTSGDDIIWDGSNDHGLQVSPGVYLWYIDSTEFRGKLTVIR